MPLLRSSPRRTAGALAALVLLAACGDDPASPEARPDDAPASAFRRLLVTDTLPFARIYDLAAATPTRVDSMGGLPGRVSYLYSPRGRVALAHFRAQHRVAFIDGGVFEQGGAGVRQAPRLLGLHEGTLPTHGNYLGGVASVFFDGTGEVAFWDEQMVAAGNLRPMLTVRAGPAHHGAGMAKPGGQFVSASIQDPRNPALPNGIVVYDRSGRAIDSTRTCPGLHGLAGNGEGVLYGCADGALHVAMQGSTPRFAKIAHASDARFGVGTVWAAEGQPRFLVRMSIRGASPASTANRQIGVADATTRVMAPIALPELDWTAAITYDGRHALVLGQSGTLYVADVATRQVTGQLARAVAAMPTSGTFVTPGFAEAAGVVYMTNPSQGEVLELTLTGGVPAVARRIRTGGTPERVVVLGVRTDRRLAAAR